MKKFLLLFIVALSFLAIACNGVGEDPVGSGSSDISFNISGAKALAGGSSSGSASPMARAAVSADLVKILEDGTVESAISFGSNGSWAPDIAFMSVGDDGSVYICFEYMYGSWDEENNVYTNVQFLRVYPDNSFDILWPIDPSADDSYESQVQTWTWYGQDLEPLVKDANGNVYFMTTEWDTNTEINHIWKYSPTAKGLPTRVTPASSDLSIESFQVDAIGNIYIKSGWSGSSSWMRSYAAGSSTFKNIYYSSDSDVWVRGYKAAPSGSSVVINGENVRGMDGIIRATITSDSTPDFELLYSSYSSDYLHYYTSLDPDYYPNSIIKIDNSTSPYTYSWVDEVLTGGVVDEVKLVNRIQGLFVNGATIKASHVAFDNLDADPDSTNTLTTRSTLKDWIRSEPEDFLKDNFDGKLFSDWKTENSLTNFYFSNINSMVYDTNNNLYGLYDAYYWNNNDSNKVVKLLDSNGNRDLSVVEVGHSGDEKPGMIKFVGDYMYYRYAVLDGSGYETGTHKLARLNYTNGIESEILVDGFFSGKDLEILSYDVSDDNSVLYFSALNYYTNEVIFGKVDLATMTYSDFNYDYTFSKITVF